MKITFSEDAHDARVQTIENLIGLRVAVTLEYVVDSEPAYIKGVLAQLMDDENGIVITTSYGGHELMWPQIRHVQVL